MVSTATAWGGQMSILQPLPLILPLHCSWIGSDGCVIVMADESKACVCVCVRGSLLQNPINFKGLIPLCSSCLSATEQFSVTLRW